MPKQKQNSDEKLSIAIPIKFTTIDRIRIKEAAQRDDLAISVWIRRVIREKLRSK